MRKIRLLWPGKTKDKNLAKGIDYYLKLLTPIVRVVIVEVKEEKGAREAAAKEAEADRLLKQTNDYFLLDERGKQFTSPEFAVFLEERENVDFIIGGAFGVSDKVREKAKGIISLSKMTLTHEMARLLFLEQIYRAFTIMKGKEYHH